MEVPINPPRESARSYRENITRILAAYPAGTPGLITALDQLCGTAYHHGQQSARDTMAQEVCEGVHASEPKGLMCRRCVETWQGFTEGESEAS